MNIFYDYYVNIFKSKYVNFSGRASRSEFWYFTLFNFMVSILLIVSDVMLGTVYVVSDAPDIRISLGLGFIYALFSFIPIVALSFRRLHDIGKSAWWLFIIFVPILGFFILIYFYIKAGDKGNNKYGSSPWKEIEALESNNEPVDEMATNILMDDSDKESVGKKIAKFVGITLLVLFVIAGGLFLFMGSAVLSIGQAIGDSINGMEVQNTIVKEGNVIKITAPLKENYELVYDNVSLCMPKGKEEDVFFKRIDAGTFGASSVCRNGKCRVSVSLENSYNYPQSIKAYIITGTVCHERSIATTTKPVIENYEVLIEMTPALLEMMDIQGDTYSVSASKTKNMNAWQLMGTKKVSFYYKERIDTDSLIIDGISKATLIYTDENTKASLSNPIVPLVKPIKKEEVVKNKAIPIEKKVKPKKSLSLAEQEKALIAEKMALEKELKRLENSQEKALNTEQELLLKELKSLKK